LIAEPRNPMLIETSPQVSAGVNSSGTDSTGNYRRTYADIRALDRALMLEDLPAARKAFTQLQKDSPFIADALSHDPFPPKSRPLRALKLLGRCLLSGNLSGARSALDMFY
jgi:hypothetical protein